MSDREKLTQALEERDRPSERDERIIDFVGAMIDGGIWPYAPAVKNLGGREVMRRALAAMDRPPFVMFDEPYPDPDTHSSRESAQARPADGAAAS